MKKEIVRMLLIKTIIGLLLVTQAYSFENINDDKFLQPTETSITPTIDGSLEDEIWKKSQPITKDFTTYDPMYGEILTQKTIIWMAYDSKNLYFAFHSYDTEPEKIKTSMTKRDNIWNDDWVGLSLDSLGNKQSSYEFYTNPYGIQGDMLRSAVSGEDISPDFVWYSAGKLTDDGYQVEICIPLQSIRFKSGKEVKMGILFMRKISRLGIMASWPDIKPGYGRFNTLATLVYTNIKIPLNLELLPSFVYGKNNERTNPNSWGETETFREIGMGIKYGITSSVTADITINPDFSQVESDAFQVEVNQRYPLFYTEKRPFFMEGINIFRFFTIHYGRMSTAVHTRQIVDPNWGAKLTGTLGKTAFGILTAGDRWPGLTMDSGQSTNGGKIAYWTISRGKYSLGGENYFGGIYSGREFAGGYNRVFGIDFMHRVHKNHQIGISFLQSYSKENEDNQNKRSSALNYYYSYNTKPLNVELVYEMLGRDFRMDSAFYTRNGISSGSIWVAPSFYPNPKKMSWLKKIQPQLIAEYLYDYTTNMNDKYLGLYIDFNFIKQGYLAFGYSIASESWINQTFDLKYFDLNGIVQITKWLHLGGRLIEGDKIFYDNVNPYLGSSRLISLQFTLQPNDKLNQYFNFSNTNFFRKSDNEKIYEVNLINSRTTYQFNKYFFTRAIIQYNSYQHKLLTDFLGSFTFIPGTVLHLGYGAIYEKRDWQQNRWVDNGFGDMLNMKRSFFFKASYLWRF